MVLVIARWQIRITRVPRDPLHRPAPPPALAAYAARQRQQTREATREQVHTWMMLHGGPMP